MFTGLEGDSRRTLASLPMSRPPTRSSQRRQLQFSDDELDQVAFDFASLAAELIADIAGLTSGTPHLTERYQRITQEVFIAIRSTIDTAAAVQNIAPRSYSSAQWRGPEHYRQLRALPHSWRHPPTR
jgi:hypothetical protein